MSRLQWTDTDTNRAHRLWAVVTFGLDEPEILPAHLRDATRDPHWRPSTLPRRPGKHVAPDDEEPSPASSTPAATVFVVYQQQRPRVLRGVLVAALVLGAGWVVWRVLTASVA